jgi:hypothetical protein
MVNEIIAVIPNATNVSQCYGPVHIQFQPHIPNVVSYQWKIIHWCWSVNNAGAYSGATTASLKNNWRSSLESAEYRFISLLRTQQLNAR